MMDGLTKDGKVPGLSDMDTSALRMNAWNAKLREYALLPSIFPGSSHSDLPKRTTLEVVKDGMQEIIERLSLVRRVLSGEITEDDLYDPDWD